MASYPRYVYARRPFPAGGDTGEAAASPLDGFLLG
eukprot:CAMPEP_0171884926 /NCGR_PEP_ID=MMETSP0992-20121227/41053_1 /TAXON_ID=483369 /ORGANISM="non described non described, Strain CCMP2098" /LENGTH=34 /DNA_ID= /DNA_START= /DNA_END= /DNA_ORIENTATION=